MEVLFDALAIMIFIVSFSIMWKKGMLKGIYNIFGHLLTFVLIAVMLTPMTQMMKTTQLGQAVSEKAETLVLGELAGEEELPTEETGLAPEIKKSLVSEGVTVVAASAVPMVTDIIMKILTAVILFIALRLLIAIVFKLLNTVFRLPILSHANKLAGGIIGIVNALIIIYLLCGVASLGFSGAENIRRIIDGTSIVKYFYNNNILLNIFIH